MPLKKFAFDVHGPRRLFIEWRGSLYFRQGDMQVWLDKNRIGLIPAQVDLRKGQELELTDNSRIIIKQVNSELRVFRNGQDLNRVNQLWIDLRVAWWFLVLIGGLDIIGGLIRSPVIEKTGQPVSSS